MDSKVSVGETLGETFSIYRDQAGVLLPVAFWLFLVSAIVEALTLDVIALFWIGTIVGMTVGTLYQGMVVGLVKDLQDGRRDSSVQELMRSVLPVFWPLLGASLLLALGIFGGALLLLVPGLYLLTIWAVVAPLIVVERRRVTDAFGRSRQLVRGNGWPVFWTMVLATLIGIAAVLGLTALAAALVEGEIVELVFKVLAQTVAVPIAALVASVLYFRLLQIERQRPEPEAIASDLPPRLPA
jgi:hypothetical protein